MGVGETGKQNKEDGTGLRDAFQTHRMELLRNLGGKLGEFLCEA